MIDNHTNDKPWLAIGGVCRDNYKILRTLVVGRKNILEGHVEVVGGGAANHALLHRNLAPRTRQLLIAALGDDRSGQELRHQLENKGVRLPWPGLVGRSTSSSDIAVHDGVSTILINPGVRTVPVPLDLVDKALREAKACCLVSPSRNEQIADILRLAASRGVPLFLSLGSSQIKELSLAELHAILAAGPVELIICNRSEAATVTGESDIRGQLEALRGETIKRIVITDGGGGLHGWTAGGYLHVPAFNDGRTIVDDVGAGDATAATIEWALVRGMELEEAMTAGARQGFEACTAIGATTNLVGAETLIEHVASASHRRSAGSIYHNRLRQLESI